MPGWPSRGGAGSRSGAGRVPWLSSVRGFSGLGVCRSCIGFGYGVLTFVLLFEKIVLAPGLPCPVPCPALRPAPRPPCLALPCVA